ncbi:NUDIX hydrolase [Nocardioides sp.]|uniref:NUDIX hydrolase n=1 Tax=Nocardioides sp. TaxID=35761 RepID=UPI002B26B94C|nr:NUDIX domain-containing protein [Nocardioides sp.]
MSGLHDDALAVLRSWPAPDADQEQARRRYVAHLEAHPDGMRRSCRPDHLTASTLVLSDDGEHVLLTLHAKAERWFQLGGHCEPGDHLLHDAASREAREESGVPDLRLDPVPVQLSEHAVPFCRDPSASTDDGLTVHHLDVRFLAVAPPGSVPAVSEESLDVRWWPADALPDPDPDLVDLVRLARERWTQSANSDGGMTFAPSDQPSR